MRSLESVLKAYTKQANGQYKGACPFTENHDARADGSKSFFMSPDINGYHCFSCRAHGNLAKLLTTRFEVSVWEAFDFVTFELFREDKPKPVDHIEEIIDWSRPPEMFLSRGFGPRLLRRFRVGSFLDLTDSETATIPMYKGSTLKGVLYRQQIGRRKKLWSSTGFDKDNFVYNEHDYNEALVVEGLTDCWRSIQYGFEQTNPLQGVHASEYFLDYLSNKKVVRLALDNDLAGVGGAETIYQRLKTRTEVLFMPYPTKDPEQCSREQWKTAYKEATPYYEFSLAMQEMWGQDYIDLRARVIKDLKRKI